VGRLSVLFFVPLIEVLLYKDQLAYCQEHFKYLKQSPSETSISRIWKDIEKWFTAKESEKGARIRGAAWPDLETPALWMGSFSEWLGS
jgi:hypothetical protein